MLDPKEVLTDHGFLQHQTGLVNMENSMDHLINHADDLRISEDDMDLLYKLLDKAGL